MAKLAGSTLTLLAISSAACSAGPTPGATAGDVGRPDAAIDSLVASDAASASPDADAGSVPLDASLVEASPEVGSAHRRAVSLALGAQVGCAILDDGAVACWGNSPPKIVLETGRRAREVAVGPGAVGDDVCLLTDDGAITCWRKGTERVSLELGGRKAVGNLVVGQAEVCAALDDRSVRCWEGLGALHDFPIKAAPTASLSQLLLLYQNELMALYDDGTIAACCADALPDAWTFPSGLFAAIAGCRDEAGYCWCGAGRDDSLYCAGLQAPARYPGVVALTIAGANGLCALRSDGAVRCWGGWQGCEDASPERSYWCDARASADHGHDVMLGQPAVAFASAAGIVPLACAILADGSIKCWGDGCAGGGQCPSPGRLNDIMNGSVEVTKQGGVVTYGAWRSIDLGAP
jgi:hypothetical protein